MTLGDTEFSRKINLAQKSEIKKLFLGKFPGWTNNSILREISTTLVLLVYPNLHFVCCVCVPE